MDLTFFLKLAGVLSGFKLLLLRTYRSTDFEVHRNWLAITHSRNISQWYYEDTSQWTLDYPPLFAYFEWTLSHVARYIDSKMLIISELPYESDVTVLFQRLTVIISDFVYIYATYRLCRDVCKSAVPASSQNWKSHPGLALVLLLLTNSGLIIVDHIHFQYNGFLFGVLLLSVVNMMTGHHLWGAFWFTCLLCLKHIYLYMAPAYVVYLLRFYIFTSSNKDGSVQWRSLSVCRGILLALVKLPVYAAAFGPFIYMGQMSQLFSRLFPFKRGLSHAYWAPNFWALYNFSDKVLSMIGQRLGLVSSVTSSARMTGGLVQEYDHTVLPSISPLCTLIITVITILPIMYRCWTCPSGARGFLRCLTMCGFSSFMFGWHVHEKAILLVIIPMSISAVLSSQDARLFQFVAALGHLSLFPLIYTSPEIPIVLSVYLSHTVLVLVLLGTIHRSKQRFYSLLHPVESFYLLLGPLVYLYWLGLHQYLLEDRLPFLPLMLISVYCGLGVTYSWIRYYRSCLTITQGKTTSTQPKTTPRKKTS